MFVKRIIEQKEKLANAIMSWERFTTDFTWFDTPTGDELEIECWKQARPTWVVEFNDQLIKENQPIHLFVARDEGVFVGVNGVVPERVAVREYKKIVNTHSTGKKRMAA